MSNSSNMRGRAYEYAVIQSIKNKVTGKVEPKIVQNSSFQANAKAWNSLHPEDQKTYIISTNAAMDTLTDLEPLLENDAFLGELILAFQSDTQGIKGDVRDIVIYSKLETTLKFDINFQGLPPEVMTFKIAWNKK